MVKQKKDIHITEQGIEEDDLLDLFVDNTASQFEDQLIKSKKKLLSAQKGRNEIFEFLKLKLKGLDMLITVMQNNKDMMRKDDLFCIEPLEKLLSYSKNDKVLFQPIVKKIKTLAVLILKNQISIANKGKYDSVIKFLVSLINNHYENSFVQTIVDVIYTDEEVFNLFLETLMDKFFKGRNLNIKSNEFKFIVRYCHNKNPNSFNMILRLMKYLGSKESGGGRTQHQVNQAISFMNYVLDHIRSKFEDDKKSDRAPRTFKEDEILQVVKNMIEIVKESLKSKDNDEAKLKSFYTELIKFYIKLHGLITKINSNFTTEVNKSQKKIQAVLLKLIESYSINGLKDKIEELSKSTLDI